MERIRELTLYQKIILLLLAAMTVLSTALCALTASQVGYQHKDAIFVPRQEAGATLYEAEIDGRNWVFTVTADTVTLVGGTKTYGPYTLLEDPTAVPEDHTYMTGIVILDGEETFFRGGVTDDPHDFWLMDEKGGHPLNITFQMGDGTEYDAYGDPFDPMEPSPYQIISLLRGPELTHKGNWEIWFMGLILAIVTVVSILFADELFYLSICFRIENAETAEPSDWHIATRNIGWFLMTLLTGAAYLTCLL